MSRPLLNSDQNNYIGVCFKYGGPPPDMDESSQPGAGHEVGGFIQLKMLMYWKKTLF
jgi:hypothetical protein